MTSKLNSLWKPPEVPTLGRQLVTVLWTSCARAYHHKFLSIITQSTKTKQNYTIMWPNLVTPFDLYWNVPVNLRYVYIRHLYYSIKGRDRQCTHNVTVRRVRVTIVAMEERITYSECVSVALVIRYAKLMRHIVIYGLSDSTIFFPHYLINGTIFEKKKKLNRKCVFWFSVQFIRIRPHIITNLSGVGILFF